ncbi:hypothetical protein FGIG_11930 [Fasciola gigantica]|uniref:Coiled-coil domain-containing protein 39 n=1 Tax=Fasciola gigantica TaxID=46835 RepID=A0A504YM68_FASGI|nr:hypothetical protein FGIG_11930 [Fasciola gigantica]
MFNFISKLDELHGRLHDQCNIYATECDKVKQLRDHMHTVKQEIDNTAALCELREQNIQDGEHLHKTVQREHGKMKMEMEKIVRLNEGVRERKSRLENLKFIKKSELEKAMQKTKQDKAGLEEWMRKIEERDEDTMIMKKYIRQDDSRIKVRSQSKLKQISVILPFPQHLKFWVSNEFYFFYCCLPDWH